MLKDNIKTILNNYLSARNQQFANHPIATVLRRDIPSNLEILTQTPDKYKFTGSAGQGNWTLSPWVGVFNKKITNSAQRGYYIVYLFREDMKGVYLSLNQGMTDIKNQTSDNARTKRILKSRASDFRNQLSKDTLDGLIEEIDLGVVNSPNAPFYEAGNIIAKYYSSDDLPSEETLEHDYKAFLNFYETIIGENLLTTIEDANEIEIAQNRFVNLIKTHKTKSVKGKAGFQGGAEEGTMYWSDDLQIWLCTRKIELSRYWNGFGVEEPEEGRGYTITTEINFPIKGIDRRIAGAFVKDQNDIYVVHRGKLGGNFNKKFFEENYQGEWTIIQDGNRKSEVVLIGGLNDPKLPEKVSNFVFEVDEMKKMDKSTKSKIWLFTVRVDDEYSFIEEDEILWNSPKDVEKDDIILIYSGSPLSSIGYIFKAKTDPFEDEGIRERWNKSAIIVDRKITIPNPLTIAELKENPIMKESYPIKMNFRRSHFKISENEWNELKNLIINKNPELKNQIITIDGPMEPPTYENGFFDFLKEKEYYFTKEIVENFLLSLKVKPFVIFTGNSGTGKTKLAQLFGQYLSQSESENKIFNTLVKVGRSADSGGWTLSKSQFFEIYPELQAYDDNEYDIEVDNIKSIGKLYLWPQLFYEKNDKKVKNRLEELAKKDSNKKINLNIQIGEIESNYKIIPVGANWTENRHLLGFHNVINKNYQSTHALDLILDASEDIINPYFLILDEMNLSHVERYFADFLSAMESGESIPLYNKTNEKTGKIPYNLTLPNNLFVVGTVNVDETTYMFSPKVLDRANTIEFSTYPAKKYILSDYEDDDLKGDIEYLENPVSNLDVRNYTIEQLKQLQQDVKINTGDYLWNVLANQIQLFQEVLAKAGFDFGFRVINEILRFMYVAWVYEGEPEIWDNWMRYFDAQIKQKMLPKLHGSQRVLENVLKELFMLCYSEEVEPSPRYFKNLETDINVKYLSSALKIKEMDKVLNEQRYVSFIN